MFGSQLDKYTYFLRIDKGEEILTTLKQFCKSNSIECGYYSGIGAIDNLDIGIWNTRTKKYDTCNFKKPLEITSLVGNVTTKDNDVWLHAHINASDNKCQVIGGHLLKANIAVTCEIFITKVKSDLIREFNEDIGIYLINKANW